MQRVKKRLYFAVEKQATKNNAREQHNTSSDMSHTSGNRHDLDKNRTVPVAYIQKNVYSTISIAYDQYEIIS